tara:strand:- start:253 stop:567 length:315 start_codon:yes stop_codon:yes gene_type:complete
MGMIEIARTQARTKYLFFTWFTIKIINIGSRIDKLSTPNLSAAPLSNKSQLSIERYGIYKKDNVNSDFNLMLFPFTIKSIAKHIVDIVKGYSVANINPTYAYSP